MADGILHPADIRKLIRQNQYDSFTGGIAKGYVQANLVVVEDSFAKDFETFCRKNPKPCPLLEIVGPHKYITEVLAKDADLRADLPQYKVFRYGKVVSIQKDIINIYQDNFVFFLLGCSFTFENALINAHIRLKHIEENKNVSMYNTNLKLEPSGPFQGNMVVSMRPIKYYDVVEACIITAHYPKMHGAPIHIGYPELIGIKDIKNVDYGDFIDFDYSEIPVFWPCGVTPQNVLVNAQIPLAITHLPGHMFISDLEDKVFYEKIE